VDFGFLLIFIAVFAAGSILFESLLGFGMSFRSECHHFLFRTLAFFFKFFIAFVASFSFKAKFSNQKIVSKSRQKMYFI